jgi:hypothetical protein
LSLPQRVVISCYYISIRPLLVTKEMEIKVYDMGHGMRNFIKFDLLENVLKLVKKEM